LSILSLPGPDRSISDNELKEFRLYAKFNRNRRIGDFLKELDLAEERHTGIPTILNELQNNGSEPPIIETDSDRSYFLITFKRHKAFKQTRGSEDKKQRRTQEQMRQEIVRELQRGDFSAREIARFLGISGKSSAYRNAIKSLHSEGIVSYTTTSLNAPNTKLTLLTQEDNE
jgi:ATP-dependent DNA helicase RecG